MTIRPVSITKDIVLDCIALDIVCYFSGHLALFPGFMARSEGEEEVANLVYFAALSLSLPSAKKAFCVSFRSNV